MVLNFILDEKEVELTEQDVKDLLIKRALEITRDPKVRISLSAIRLGLSAVTSKLFLGRQRALEDVELVRFPFSGAWQLKLQLEEILELYCFMQTQMSDEDWDAGWETEVVPQVEALR